MGMPSEALQIIFEMQKPVEELPKKRAIKKNTFFELQNAFFFHSFFFILTPPTSSVHNFLIYFIFFGFKLSDLNSFEIRHLKLYKSSFTSN
jgi:hypothetical protein